MGDERILMKAAEMFNLSPEMIEKVWDIETLSEDEAYEEYGDELYDIEEVAENLPLDWYKQAKQALIKKIQITESDIRRMVIRVINEVIDERHGSIADQYEPVAKYLADAGKRAYDEGDEYVFIKGDEIKEKFGIELPQKGGVFVVPTEDEAKYGSYSPLPKGDAGILEINYKKDGWETSVIPTVIHELTHGMNAKSKSYSANTREFNKVRGEIEDDENQIRDDAFSTTMGNVLYYFNESEMNARISEFRNELMSPKSQYAPVVISFITGGFSNQSSVDRKNMFRSYIYSVSDSLCLVEMTGLVDRLRNIKFGYKDFQTGMEFKNRTVEPISSIRGSKKILPVKINTANIKDEETYQEALEKLYSQLDNAVAKFKARADKTIFDFFDSLDFDATAAQRKYVFKKDLQQSSLQQRWDSYNFARKGLGQNGKAAYDLAKRFRNKQGYTE